MLTSEVMTLPLWASIPAFLIMGGFLAIVFSIPAAMASWSNNFESRTLEQKIWNAFGGLCLIGGYVMAGFIIWGDL